MIRYLVKFNRGKVRLDMTRDDLKFGAREEKRKNTVESRVGYQEKGKI
jgi:hypothetical protein